MVGECVCVCVCVCEGGGDFPCCLDAGSCPRKPASLLMLCRFETSGLR